MYDGFLGIRRGIFIADCCSGSVAGIVIICTRRAKAKAIMPCAPYLIIAGIVILEIVYDKVIAGCKAPDIAGPWAVGIDAVDFINPPVISRFQ